jgi:hypothetical protein
MCDGLVLQQVVFGNDQPTEAALQWLRTMIRSLAETQGPDATPHGSAP